MNKIKAYLGLGSNMGERGHYLKLALLKLNETAGITVTKVSSLYETKPVGYTEQPDFLNYVAEISTTKTPHQLLETCMEIEKGLDRKREIHWGPRTVDIDILLYDEAVITTETLTVPHPRMHQRAFVLIPLTELIPQAVHPILQKTITVLADAVREDKSQEIHRTGELNEWNQ